MGPQSRLPPCDPCPRALRKSPSWKGSGEQGPTPDSSSEESPVVTWVMHHLGHHQLGPWT